MAKGTTKSGFKFTVDDSITDNMELVDALADLNDGDNLAMSRVCRIVLGNDQRKKLYDHLRDEKGCVPASKVSNEIVEIVNSIGTGKKSSSSPT